MYRRKKRPTKDVSKLSFEDESEDTKEIIISKKIKKNPNVDTSFLPDKVREELEQLERTRLKDIWLARQEKIKLELVRVQFSFWDGTGHPAILHCPKGHTIKEFLEIAKKEFVELRSMHVDNLIFVKEDLIIPHV